MGERAPGLRRVLVANRGEIAVRIVRACHDLGLEAIVACSEADRGSLAVELADRSVCVGPAPVAASYRNAGAILAAATALGVDAIHPGYGFLAEDAAFAARCAEAGLAFVGPPADAIERVGDKVAARRLAAAAGVPLVPGSDGPVDARAAGAVAGELGFPLLVKAAAGGGGRGMRVVRSEAELEATLADASTEAASAFGDGSVYLERFVDGARHVEIQVAFDASGRGVALGERDCTIQRRYQKLVEEAPSPAVTESVRARLAEAALALCRAVGYRNVGTVEFLLEPATGACFFIEMNARLQVEHPVTELVTGIDLVALQLRLASGQPLDPGLADVRPRGHAIEFRVNAEDPEAGFRPAAGSVERWLPPLGPGVRVDTHLRAGERVPPYYDSLLAKLVVWGRDRAEAVARSRRALAEIVLDGLPTTVPFHRWLIEQDAFRDAAAWTGWAEAAWAAREVPVPAGLAVGGRP